MFFEFRGVRAIEASVGAPAWFGTRYCAPTGRRVAFASTARARGGATGFETTPERGGIQWAAGRIGRLRCSRKAADAVPIVRSGTARGAVPRYHYSKILRRPSPRDGHGSDPLGLQPPAGLLDRPPRVRLQGLDDLPPRVRVPRRADVIVDLPPPPLPRLVVPEVQGGPPPAPPPPAATPPPPRGPGQVGVPPPPPPPAPGGPKGRGPPPRAPPPPGPPPGAGGGGAAA